MKGEQKNRLTFIDAIRACAAFTVLATHMGNTAEPDSILYGIINVYQKVFSYFLWCNDGLHPGVIVFIVLSGFVIHMPQARRSQLELNIGYYSRRRFFRIYPVLLVSMLFGYVTWIYTHGFNSGIFLNIVTSLFLLPGIMPLPGPFGNIILITVIVECLLYIIYPIGLSIIRRYTWQHIIVFGVFIYFANFSLVVVGVKPSWLIQNIFSFFIYWWAGAFAVEYAINRQGTEGYLAFWKCLLAYVLYFVVSHAMYFKGAHIFKSLLLAMTAAYFLVALFNLSRMNNKPSRNVIYDTAVWLGERSYSLYVIHIPVLSLITLFINKNNILGANGIYIATLVAVIIITSIFYVLIERPLHNYAVKSSISFLN